MFFKFKDLCQKVVKGVVNGPCGIDQSDKAVR